jgi:hypothetical protein
MSSKGRAALCVALLLARTPAVGATDTDYLAVLIAKSRQLQLAKRPEWLKLVHYVSNPLSPGVHGLVVSADFYNASDGRSNPQAELEATLASFYSDIEETNERQNPQCAFIARFAWLDEQLAFDAHRLPRRACTRYHRWHASLDPGGATLIFASAYINSPSSMFGHTLLRFDAKDQDARTRLLAYSINFAANTKETSGIAFAVNGLFGGYPGAFSILPYYAKVREYSDLENRDIWEYELNLSPEEIDRVLMHAWELGSVYFQYFFLDQNCSYQLLGLLQVARPELDLTTRFRLWAAPSDTVRVATEQPDLIKGVVYRPSSATVIRHRLSALSEPDRRLVKDLSVRGINATDPAISALPETRAAAVIEASQDYVSYRRAIGKTDVPDPGGLEHELLAARSRLDVASQAPEVSAPPARPEQGHDSSRLSLGTGRWGGQDYQELSARAAYHGIMDPDEGYVRGAQFEFLNLAVRRYDDGKTRVENITPLDILSLTPRDDFFQPLSWKIGAGWERVRLQNGSEPLVFALNGGAGGAWSSVRDTAVVYAFVDASSRISHDFASGYDLGAGTSIGALFDASSRWRIHGYARTVRYFLGQHDTPLSVGLEQRITMGRDLALRLDVARDREFKRSFNNGSVAILFYF